MAFYTHTQTINCWYVQKMHKTNTSCICKEPTKDKWQLTLQMHTLNEEPLFIPIQAATCVRLHTFKWQPDLYKQVPLVIAFHTHCQTINSWYMHKTYYLHLQEIYPHTVMLYIYQECIVWLYTNRVLERWTSYDIYKLHPYISFIYYSEGNCPLCL